jgi:tRNA(Ile)-lysidine synthase
VSRRVGLAERVDTFIEGEKLLRPGDCVLVAVSGGLDSCVLLHYLVGAGYSVGIAHCNYRRRGEESDKDEQFVRQLSIRYAADFHVAHFSGKYETRPGFPARSDRTGNFQARARHFRYRYCKKILNEYHYDRLVTAHHLDDNLETLLMNLSRGSGYPGLAGIPVRGDLPLARPLLCVDRSEILAYAREHDLDWREDESNASDDYLRNRIRHHLLPVLKETLALGPDNLGRSFALLRGGRHFYEQGLSLEKNPELRRRGSEWLLHISRSSLTRDQQFTLLRHHLRPGYPISDADLGHVLGMTAGDHWSHKGLRVRRTENELLFEHATPCSGEEVVISDLPYTYSIGNERYYFSIVDRPNRLRQPGVWHLRVPEFPLHLRPRKNGDRLRPLGLGGSKKVKDMLIDAKIPVWERERPMVLTDAKQRILALLDHCIDQDSALGSEDKRALRIQKTASPAS